MKVLDKINVLKVIFEQPDWNGDWARKMTTKIKERGGKFDYATKAWFLPNTAENRQMLEEEDRRFKERRVIMEQGFVDEQMFLIQFDKEESHGNNNRGKNEKKTSEIRECKRISG